MERDVGSRP